MSFITQLWQGVRETGRGSVTDAKDALESRVSSISRRPICLLKCPFPRGPGRENVGEVTAPTRTAPSSLRQTTQRRRVGKINPRQRARRGLEGTELGSVSGNRGEKTFLQGPEPCEEPGTCRPLLLKDRPSTASDHLLPGSSLAARSPTTDCFGNIWGTPQRLAGFYFFNLFFS